jgi:hypothetical protein
MNVGEFISVTQNNLRMMESLKWYTFIIKLSSCRI